jgi:DNA invertase Pin-like site-specific DNA recombinase
MNKRKGQDVGYIRVSSISQNTDRQLVDIELDTIFEEKVSTKDTNRPELKRCMTHLRNGDTLHVHSIDRLARDLRDLENIIEELTAKGVEVRFHKENLSFTGDDSPMSKLLLQLLGAVAGFERSIIKERQREGIAARKAKGLPVGAKHKLTDSQTKDLHNRVDSGESKASIAKDLGISRPTLYSYLNNR